MSVRLHMMSVYKREYCNEIEKDYKGNIHDYNLSVKYYPKTYFRGNRSNDVALWMAWHFEDSTIHYFIPDGDAEGAVWEIGKDAFKRVQNSNRLLKEAITSAIKYGFADTEDEVREFLNDAVASESSDDIVRLEWW